MAELSDTLENTNKSLDGLTVALDAFKAGTDVQSALIAKLFDPEGKLAEFEQKFVGSIEGINGILKERVKDIVSNARADLKEQGFSDEDITQRTALLGDFLDNRVRAVIETTGEVIDGLAKGFSDSMSKAFADMVAKGEFSAKKIGNAFLKAAIEAASKEFVAKPLGKFFDSLFKGIFGRAGGGAVHAGTPVLVGERGPEVFVPRIAGAVLNTHDSRRALAGPGPVTINQTLNFATDVKNTVRAEIMNIAPLIANQAALSVHNALRGIRI